ncbi:hypothetical protein CYMTET_44329 [Cymbomonas tetramitiformis]|uniref:Uncharacterized protein n=1 Tax=Cymbomonas tetramitiformis TaxID=36881 RepID=A0AAE0C1M0_9CHLO|nr:hypothetical protein CYMTET_44329 [Cymbomonas tetramitiformis]|eukprot:gene172-306_t
MESWETVDSKFERALRLCVYITFWVADWAVRATEREDACSLDFEKRIELKLMRMWMVTFMLRRIQEPNHEIALIMRSTYFLMCIYRSLEVVYEICFNSARGRGNVLRRELSSKEDVAVYTQQIENKILWFTVDVESQAAKLLDGAITAHETVCETFRVTCEILTERAEDAEKILGNVRMERNALEILRRYCSEIESHDGPNGSVLAVCVPMIDPKHLTAVAAMAESYNSLASGRKAILDARERLDQAAYEEVRSNRLQVSKRVYAVMNGVIQVCANLCGHRFVHDITRETVSHYARYVVAQTPRMLRACRECLEACDDTKLAWMICFHTHLTVEYLLDVLKKYGSSDTNDVRCNEEHEEKIRAEALAALHVCKARCSDSPELRESFSAHEEMRRFHETKRTASREWLAQFNRMSQRLHTNLLGDTHN